MKDLPTISQQDSLLAATNPANINELFNRDPLGYAASDLTAIVSYFREKREQWTLEEKKEKAKPTTRVKAAAKVPATLADLKDLTF